VAHGADSTGTHSDDVAVPEVTWDAMTSSPPPTAHWPTGFVTCPSPDPPQPGIESSFDAFCLRAGWVPEAGAPDTSPHDHWLHASYSATSEDRWLYPTYSYFTPDTFPDPAFFCQPEYIDPFLDRSLDGVNCGSQPEYASSICLQELDDDYIDDVLSVMAKFANAPTPIVAVA